MAGCVQSSVDSLRYPQVLFLTGRLEIFAHLWRRITAQDSEWVRHPSTLPLTLSISHGGEQVRKPQSRLASYHPGNSMGNDIGNGGR